MKFVLCELSDDFRSKCIWHSNLKSGGYCGASLSMKI